MAPPAAAACTQMVPARSEWPLARPGSRCACTPAGHPWIVRDVESERRMCTNGAQAIVAGTEETVCTITKPPQLPWRVRVPGWCVIRHSTCPGGCMQGT